MSLDNDDFFFRNTGRNLKNDSFLEEVTFELVARGNNEEKEEL